MDIIQVESPQNIKILEMCSKYISDNHIFGLSMALVPPEDPRVSCQIQIFDFNSGKDFTLMANNEDDVYFLFPKLIHTIVTIRKQA